MTLIRWNPVLPVSRELANARNEMDRLFDEFFGARRSWLADVQPQFVPAVDIEETEDSFVFHADLPGMSHKDVKVSLLGDTLTIRGERVREEQSSKGTRTRTERSYGAFERSFTLGAPVKAEGVRATFRDGVLEVRVPKAEEARVREIQVQVG
uniref:Hsp20/alpha crystallin family protein n=1 Tax=Eiseniibacteriota bacterium TaxID=2212470 RepID=A0A832I7H0_UNCEI